MGEGPLRQKGGPTLCTVDGETLHHIGSMENGNLNSRPLRAIVVQGIFIFHRSMLYTSRRQHPLRKTGNINHGKSFNLPMELHVMARMTEMPTRTCYDYDYPIASQIFLALSETDYFGFFFSCLLLLSWLPYTPQILNPNPYKVPYSCCRVGERVRSEWATVSRVSPRWALQPRRLLKASGCIEGSSL